MFISCACCVLWPLACWDCGFESRRRLGCLSVVIVVYCGRWLAAIAGSSPAGGMDVCLFWVLCVVR